MTLDIRWAIPGRLALFARPQRADFERIAREGFGMILSVYDPEKPSSKVEWAAPVDASVVRAIPAKDFHPIDFNAAEIESLAADARRVWQAGRPIGIHCGAGIGRTGTLAILLLAGAVKDARSWPEEPSQRQQLSDFMRRDRAGRRDP